MAGEVKRKKKVMMEGREIVRNLVGIEKRESNEVELKNQVERGSRERVCAACSSV